MKTTNFTTANVTIIDRIRGFFKMRKINKQIAERRKVLDAMLQEMPKKPCYNISDNDIIF